MMDYFIGMVFGGSVLLVGLGATAVVDYASCLAFQSGTGIETKWRFGCYAKVDGQWVPKEYAFGKVNELRIKDK